MNPKERVKKYGSIIYCPEGKDLCAWVDHLGDGRCLKKGKCDIEGARKREKQYKENRRRARERYKRMEEHIYSLRQEKKMEHMKKVWDLIKSEPWYATKGIVITIIISALVVMWLKGILHEDVLYGRIR